MDVLSWQNKNNKVRKFTVVKNVNKQQQQKNQENSLKQILQKARLNKSLIIK